MLSRLSLIALLATAGCGSLSRSAPEVRAWVVRAERPTEAEPPSEQDVAAVDAAVEVADLTRPTLEVRRLRLSPRYDTRSFVYRTSEHGYESDFYNEFFASPADLLTEETRRWLEASDLFEHVVGPESRVLGGLILEGQIVAIYADDSGPKRRAVIELQFLLISEPGSVVAGSYSSRAEVEVGAGRSPQTLVDGWCQALAQVLGELEQALGTNPVLTASS